MKQLLKIKIIILILGIMLLKFCSNAQSISNYISLSVEDWNNVECTNTWYDPKDKCMIYNFYFANDIITLVKYEYTDYIVYSESTKYPIGIFDVMDAFTLLYWIDEFPLIKEEWRYAQHVYQEIVADKIWE